MTDLIGKPISDFERDSAEDSVRKSVFISVWYPVAISVWGPVWHPVGTSVWASVWYPVMDSLKEGTGGLDD